MRLLDDHQPRQLGSLHDRMSYLLHLLRHREQIRYADHNIGVAIEDLATIVAHIPDVAFNTGSGPETPLVSANRKNAKRGLDPQDSCGLRPSDRK